MSLRLLLWLAILMPTISMPSVGARESPTAELIETYRAWRQAMVRKDARLWQRFTAPHRQAEIRNRVISEKRAFPAAVFQTPTQPPALEGLDCLYVSRQGPTAKASFFGPIDFGVGGQPTDNLLVLSFVIADRRWTYDQAEFVNLAALPEVRRELAAGKLDYLKQTPECQASGRVPRTPPAAPAPAVIAKVYAFCPGREVEVQINGLSRHRFANEKTAEIVIGGARRGRNEVTYRTEKLDGAQGDEAFALRVYLMSEIPGTKPIIAFERVAQEGQPVKALESDHFAVADRELKKLVR
jgi:hypothetical protein